MEMLYKRYDSYGFRSFTWDDYKMETDPNGKVSCHDYLQYLDLMDEKKRLKRKRERTYKTNLIKLRKLKVRDNSEKPI